ncbi:Alpha/Beta hydrolase protein [Infundibulicybe gibba]|nr:Alpha/Beta hydrolase protein [Infundibulicybe gibba]
MREVEYRNTTNGNKFLTSADGTSIYAEAVGRTPGPGVPTIVFIHGLLMSSAVFDTIFTDDAWTRNTYLVRYDVRGQGRSGQPCDEAGWESKRFAEDFETVMNAFKLDRPFVAGWAKYANARPSTGVWEVSTNITDILSFHPAEYLAGIIYIAPIPYTAIAYEVGTLAAGACVSRLCQPTSVPVFQSAAQDFVSLCSGTGHGFSFALYRMCLGNAIVQPVETTGQLMSRAQDEKGLLGAGHEGRLPLLFLYGTQDEVTKHEPVLDAIAGWTRLDKRAIKAGHTLWLEEPIGFRETILQWTHSVCQKETV